MLVYNLVITRRGNKGISNPARFKGLQIGARRITNDVSSRDLKWGQKDYKSGQERLQTEVGISNRGRDFKSMQSNLS